MLLCDMKPQEFPPGGSICEEVRRMDGVCVRTPIAEGNVAADLAQGK